MTGNDLLRAVGSADDKDLERCESVSARAGGGRLRILYAAAAALVIGFGIFAVISFYGRQYEGEHSAFLPSEKPTETQTNAPVVTDAADNITPDVTNTPTEAVETPLPTEPVTVTEDCPNTEFPTQPAVTNTPPAPITEIPTEKPTPMPTQVPTPVPTPVPTSVPEQPTPTPQISVPTDAPFFCEFQTEEELKARIQEGGEVFGSIHYYYKPKHVPEGARLSQIIVGNNGISFDYVTDDPDVFYSFEWVWNTAPDEYIAFMLDHGYAIEHIGRYYMYEYENAGREYLSIFWGQDGAAFAAFMPRGSTQTEIEYFCDAKLVPMT